jgi:SSS family solute:Na+ symporter
MDSNLTSMATLYWCDVHKRLFPQTDERRGIVVLRIATIAFAILGTLAALGLLRSQQILNDWWMLAGISSGGMLGLFLLGRFFPRATGRDAAWGAVCGTAVILWMTISAKTDWLPMATYEMPSMFGAGNVLSLGWRSPFNENLILVVGTITVILAGMVSCRVHRALGLRRQGSEPDRE